MTYIFKEKLTFNEYNNFLKKQDNVSFMQEDNWAKVKNIKEHLIVGVIHNNEVCAIAHILINKINGGKQLFIPNGYLLDFTNKNLLDFMTQNIKKLAHKYKAYIVDIYPNITNINQDKENIHNNLINLNYKYTNEYLDNTKNMLIPMKKNGKKISKMELKRKYENKATYLKKGIYFEISNNIEDIKRIKNLVNKKYVKEEILKGLLKNYNNRVKFIFAKLDLVFYFNYLKENNGDTNEINKIEELLTISDELDIGCALIIEPYASGNCELLYNIEKESFENLDIMNGIIYETMKICNKENYEFIKISNFDLNTDFLCKRYNGTPIEYIGHYSIIINKFKYFMNRPIKKR